MSDISQSPQKDHLDALAERVRTGIAKKSIHLLFEDELGLIWNHQDKSEEERLLMIKNFATVYGLDAHVSESATMAIFKNSN